MGGKPSKKPKNPPRDAVDIKPCPPLHQEDLTSSSSLPPPPPINLECQSTPQWAGRYISFKKEELFPILWKDTILETLPTDLFPTVYLYFEATRIQDWPTLKPDYQIQTWLGGTFEWPSGVAIDRSNLLHIADCDTRQIQVFNPDGTFLRKTPFKGNPSGLIFDAQGNLIVLSESDDTVTVLDPSGEQLYHFGGRDFPGGRFHLEAPQGVALTTTGNIIVTEKKRVRICSLQGDLICKFGKPGSDPGGFAQLRGVATTPEGLIVVSDGTLHRIQIFDEAGKFIKMFGRRGNGPGEFLRPCGIAIDRHGFMVIADEGNLRLQVFSPECEFLKEIKLPPGHFLGKGGFMPAVPAIDRSGNLIVVDADSDKVFVFG